MLLAGQEDIEVVAEASNGLEAVSKAARFQPTIVLMDIRMPEQLLAAIRTVAAGDALLAPAITKRVIKQFARIPWAPEGFDELTEREREILRLIVNGLSNAEIGRELYISDTTVKTHVTHILHKLNLRDRVQAVVLAYQSGLFETDALGPGRRGGNPGFLTASRTTRPR
jgi:DNA-binding NarL/FixJ family response regulator